MNLLNRLSRVTTPQRVFIPQIDGLRFVALMAVIAYHIRGICSFHFNPGKNVIEGDPINDLFSVGHYGVALFFSISGFILALPFARQFLCQGKKVSQRDYYLRRVTRIEPPYLIHLAFLALFCALVLRWQPAQSHLYQNPEWASYAGKHLLVSLVYSNGFVFGTHPFPNVVLWSLEIEVQFYILAPFFASIFRISDAWKRRGLLVLIIAVGPWCVQSLLGSSYQVGFSFLGQFQYFLMGFLLADLYLLKKSEITSSFVWDLVVPAAVALVVLLRHSVFLDPLLPWLIFLAFVAAFRGVMTPQVLSSVWITTIGGMCYTIYMYHWIMISVLVRVTGRFQTHISWLDLLIQMIAMSAIIIAVCAVLFVFLERPFMQRNWPAMFWQFLSHRGKIRSEAVERRTT